jgi:L-ascorbate metabolism protein UlaG (beta-lactamase superfamily)
MVKILPGALMAQSLLYFFVILICLLVALNAKSSETYSQSPQYNAESGKFQNLDLVKSDLGVEKVGLISGLNNWFFGTNNRTPLTKLPEIKPDIEAFLQAGSEYRTIWLGHSSLLIIINGNTVLVDPVLSSRAAPFWPLAPRFQAPVVSVEELPPIDYVLITHDHYDHLDRETIQHLFQTDAKFITPIGVGKIILEWGGSSENIVEKDWWESHKDSDIEFVATPARHSSGRSLFNKNSTLWASWVVISEDYRFYFSGDSAYDTHFSEIGKRYGPFDVAYIETGQFHPRFREGHMFPKDWYQAFIDVNAKAYFPVHWGMFSLAPHAWNDPIEKIFHQSKKMSFTLLAPRLGEIVSHEREFKSDTWWRF